MAVKMDDGRRLEIDPARHPHLDHGYAVTSHSSQGQTADRVLIHVDTDLGAKDLLNNRMAYVAVSRGAHDAQLFTNNREQLGAALGRDVSHRSAHTPEMKRGAGHSAAPAGDRAQTGAVARVRHGAWFVARQPELSWVTGKRASRSWRQFERWREQKIEGRLKQQLETARGKCKHDLWKLLVPLIDCGRRSP